MSEVKFTLLNGTKVTFSSHAVEKIRCRQICDDAIRSDLNYCMDEIKNMEKGKFQLLNYRMNRTIVGYLGGDNTINVITAINEASTPNLDGDEYFLFSKSQIPNKYFESFSAFLAEFEKYVKKTSIRITYLKNIFGFSGNTVTALLDVSKLKNSRGKFIIPKCDVKDIVAELRYYNASIEDLSFVLQESLDYIRDLLDNNTQSVLDTEQKECERIKDIVANRSKHILDESLEVELIAYFHNFYDKR